VKKLCPCRLDAAVDRSVSLLPAFVKDYETLRC